MDEALVTCDLDISGRSFLVFNVDIPKVNLGNYESEMTEEFFRAVAYNMNATLHLNEAYGRMYIILLKLVLNHLDVL